MKRMMLGLSLFLAASGTAQGQSVEIGTGDWSEVPAIQPRGNMHVTARIMDRLHRIAAESRCTVQGFTRRRIAMTVPFVIRFTPQGAVERIILRDLSCPQLESVLGAVLLQMAHAGAYRPTGENRERWYRSELSFQSQ